MATGKNLSFSEQQLVDCVFYYFKLNQTYWDGCQGGWMDYAYFYIYYNGISLSSDYPYTSALSGKVFFIFYILY